jgi:hypothetical protein
VSNITSRLERIERKLGPRFDVWRWFSDGADRYLDLQSGETCTAAEFHRRTQDYAGQVFVRAYVGIDVEVA